MPEILLSKKFQAALLAILLVILGEGFGVHLEQDTLMALMAPVVAYILGQGIADHGKEAEKVNLINRIFEQEEQESTS